jgi:hypothetical protein
MFFGPLRPLSPEIRLSDLLRDISPVRGLGAWVSGCSSGQRIYLAQGRPVSLLLSPDLGFLLHQCSRIVVRQSGRPSTLKAESIIQWRALQVATATPWLPGYQRLAEQYPGLHLRPNGVVVPLRARSPEEVLAECLASGLQISSSRVIYTPPHALPPFSG